MLEECRRRKQERELFAFYSDPQWWWEWSGIKQGWSKRAPRRKTLTLKSKAFPIPSLDGLQDNRTYRGSFSFISFLSDDVSVGWFFLFFFSLQFLCCLHTLGCLCSCYLQMEVAEKGFMRMCT